MSDIVGTCTVCGAHLWDWAVSEWFCNSHCQREWHAQQVGTTGAAIDSMPDPRIPGRTGHTSAGTWAQIMGEVA